MTTLTLTVPKLACGACVETVTKAVQALDPSAQVEASTQTKAVVIQSAASPEAIQSALVAAGYPPV